MGVNKTTIAILRASQSVAGVYEIKWSFDKATNIHRVSQTHSARSSVEDELMMLQDLKKLRPFRVVSGRCHTHFPDIAISTTAILERAVHLAGKAQEPNWKVPVASTVSLCMFDSWLSRHFSSSTSFPLALLTYQVLLNLKIRLPCENYTGF